MVSCMVQLVTMPPVMEKWEYVNVHACLCVCVSLLDWVGMVAFPFAESHHLEWKEGRTPTLIPSETVKACYYGEEGRD